MTRPATLFTLVLAAIALGGCMERDPYRRTDVWRPTGANAANIAAMVADPRDLIQGRGTARADTAGAVTAIDRVSTDRPRPLLMPAPGSGAGGGSGAGTGTTQPGS